MEQPHASDNRISNRSERLDYLDAIRGFCVLLVVIAHHLIGVRLMVDYLHAFALTPFFLVTGYLQAQKLEWERPFRELFVKNLKRFLYPYFTLSLINMVWNLLYYKVVFPTVVPEPYPLDRLHLFSVTTYSYNALWAIPCAMWGSILFLSLRKHRRHMLLWGATAVFLVVFYIFFDTPLSGKGFVSYLYCYIFRSVMCMIFIYAGYLLYELLKRIDRRTENLLLIISGILSAIILLLYQFMPDYFPTINLATHELGNPYFYYPFAMIPASFFFLLLRRYARPGGILAYFGRHSLIVMALHMDIFVLIAWYIVAKLGLADGSTFSSLLVILLELLMSPVFISVINRYFPFVLSLPKRAAKK